MEKLKEKINMLPELKKSYVSVVASDTDIMEKNPTVIFGLPNFPMKTEASTEEEISSIGECSSSDSDENVDKDEVDSKKFVAGSLPIIKSRGLSSYFSGKARSVRNVKEAEERELRVEEMEKEERPFNKRRRIMIAEKRRKKQAAKTEKKLLSMISKWRAFGH